jgi:hypothetical protein
MNQSEMPSMRYSRIVGLMLLCAAGGTALAQTTVPHTFTSGTQARASEVNANFQALATAIDNLSARVGKLEGGTTDADVVGTYSWRALQIGVGWEVAPRPADIEAIVYAGTFTLAADHTFTASFIGRSNDAFGPSPDDGALTGTWSLTDNLLTLLVPEQEAPAALPFACTPGCGVAVAVHYDSASGAGDDGLNNLMMLIKNPP